MALNHQDFALTPVQLQAINDHVQERCRAFVQEDEDLEGPEISVRFVFLPVYGRFVYVAFEGEKPERVIEYASAFTEM